MFSSSHNLRHSMTKHLKEVQHLSPDQIVEAFGHYSVITSKQHNFHGMPSPMDQGIL